jgi:hypothetical protein
LFFFLACRTIAAVPITAAAVPAAPAAMNQCLMMLLDCGRRTRG